MEIRFYPPDNEAIALIRKLPEGVDVKQYLLSLIHDIATDVIPLPKTNFSAKEKGVHNGQRRRKEESNKHRGARATKTKKKDKK